MGKTIFLLHTEHPLSLVIKVITDFSGLVLRSPVVIYLLTLLYLVLGLLSIIVLQQLIDSIVESISLQLDVPNKMFHCSTYKRVP